MTRLSLLFALLAAPAFAQTAVVNGPNGAKKVPLFSDQAASTPVAQVESQVVTLQELQDALADLHGAHHDSTNGGKKDFRPVLDRLIGARLVALEAHDMGLDELPEVKQAVEKYGIGARREVLRKRLIKDVKPDMHDAERYFREAVRELRVRSILFSKEADAKEMSAALKAGKSWDELTKAAIAAKKGEMGSSGEYVSPKNMLPQVAAAAESLFGGQVSDPVPVEGGFALVRVDDVRYPEDPSARAEATARALDEAREKEINRVYEEMVKKDAKLDKKLLEKLDFEAKKPGFAKLEKDKRVLAQLTNGTKITVADLAAVLRTNFFHGVEEAVRLKRVNSFRYGTFNKMLYRAIFDLEAEKQKITQSEDYLRAVNDYKEAIVFDQFVQRAVMQDIKVSEAEGKAYYEKHKAEYAFPAFYTLDSLSFQTGRAAESALSRLKAGTDFKWLKTNADGQVPEEKRNLSLGNGTLSAKSLPPALVSQLQSAKPGDLRLFSQDGQHHVVLVKAAQPSKDRPYLEVRAEIGKKLSSEKLNQALQDWIAKLRKAHDVKVYLSQIES